MGDGRDDLRGFHNSFCRKVFKRCHVLVQPKLLLGNQSLLVGKAQHFLQVLFRHFSVGAFFDAQEGKDMMRRKGKQLNDRVGNF